jgi:glucose-1-phosphate thymidylyltransferase
MLPIGNKPILEYVIEALRANGILDIVLVVGYHKEMVQDYFGSGERLGIKLRYVIQDHQLGTGHALSAAEQLADEQFLVVPGDNIFHAEAIKALVGSSPNSVLVTNKARGEQYGVVDITNGIATNLVEKPIEQTSPWINTGAYFLSNGIFEYLAQELNLPDAINNFIKDGKKITAVETTKNWWDAIYPWDLLKMNGLALTRFEGDRQGQIEAGVTVKGSVTIGPGSVVRANSYIVGPVIIGEGCEVGPGAVIFPYTSIGSNVVIEAFTQLRNCIIGESVQIGSHSHLTDTIIGGGSAIGPYFVAASTDTMVIINGVPYSIHTGATISENVRIGSSVSLAAGVQVGHGASISDMKQIQSQIPDSAHIM